MGSHSLLLGIEPGCPVLQADSLPPEPPGKPIQGDSLRGLGLLRSLLAQMRREQMTGVGTEASFPAREGNATRSPTNVGLCRTGQITVLFCGKCHLRMPRCGYHSRLLTHQPRRASKPCTHCTAVLFEVAESDQACFVAELDFPKV